MTTKNKLSYFFQNFSIGNLEKTQRILEVILDQLELVGYNRSTGLAKIPLDKLTQKGLNYDEVNAIIEKIDGITPLNGKIKRAYRWFNKTLIIDNTGLLLFKKQAEMAEMVYGKLAYTAVDLLDFTFVNDLPPEAELTHYIFIQINKNDLPEELKRAKKIMDKKIKTDTKADKEVQTKQEPSKFVISVKDREIWVNEYLIGKPHAVGSNLEFFEYVQRQSPNTKIERNKLPDSGGLSLKREVKSKSFIKILNELGFKDEILKAFFYKRSKDTLIYRGDKITKKDLEKAGGKILLFLKELELAHIKNSPE